MMVYESSVGLVAHMCTVLVTTAGALATYITSIARAAVQRSIFRVMAEYREACSDRHRGITDFVLPALHTIVKGGSAQSHVGVCC